MNSNLIIGLLAALSATLIGSGWQIASRYGVTTTLGPLELAALRYGVPALLLLPLLLKTGLLPRQVPRGQLALLVLGGGLPFGLVVLAGLQWAPAAHLGVFMGASIPLFTMLAGRLASGEALGRTRLLGLLVIVAGIAVFGAGAWAGMAQTWRGDLLFVMAALMWSMHTLLFRRSGLTPWEGAALFNAWSILVLLPVLAVVGAPRLFTVPWRDLAFQAAGQGVAAGLLGLVAYMAAIARLGPGRASLSAALVPLTTAIGAAWLLGEALQRSTIAAALLVAVGVALAGGALAWRKAP